MRTDKGVEMPRRATTGSAGYDFFAPEDIVIKAGEYTTVSTGVHLEKEDLVGEWISYPVMVPNVIAEHIQIVHRQWAFILHPKSGLAFNHGVRLLGGVIDMDYVREDDEIKAKLTADEDIVIEKGQKFMQGILMPFGTFIGEIRPTEDRNGGFGSTGA